MPDEAETAEHNGDIWSRAPTKYGAILAGKNQRFLLGFSIRPIIEYIYNERALAGALIVDKVRFLSLHTGAAIRFSHIFSGAETPMMARETAITRRTQSARYSRASSRPGSASLMRQIV